MNKQDVIDLIKAIKNIGVEVWLDGGWGVDALIGAQTRMHNDVDIFIEKKNAEAINALLTERGYHQTKTDFTTQDHLVWLDKNKRIVDLHLFEFAEAGKLYFEDTAYPSEVISGIGKIGEIEVRCLTADAQVLFHQGYEHDNNDIHDVLMLCKKFKIAVPSQYKQKS